MAQGLVEVRLEMLSLLMHAAWVWEKEPHEIPADRAAPFHSAAALKDVYAKAVRILHAPMPKEPETERRDELSLEEIVPYREWQHARDQYYEALIFAGLYRALYAMDYCLSGGRKMSDLPALVPEQYQARVTVRVDGTAQMLWSDFCNYCLPDYSIFRTILTGTGHPDHGIALRAFNRLAESEVLVDIKEKFGSLAQEERNAAIVGRGKT